MDWNDFSQTDIEVLVPPQILERGLNYFQQGQLIKACRLGDLLAGVLIGTGGNYRVRLWFKDSGLQGDCTCPYDGFCKHMVALAAGWLENRSFFIDLQPQLNQTLAEPAKMSEILRELVQKDPVHFLELMTPVATQPEFITTKGLLNLIRNTFSFPKLTHDEMDVLWEQTLRLEGLVMKALTDNEPEAPLLIAELLTSITGVLEEAENQVLSNLFQDMLTDLLKLALGKPLTYLAPVLDKLAELYLNPRLFEYSAAMRTVLNAFIQNYPGYIIGNGQLTINNYELTPLQLMLLYELYGDLEKYDQRIRLEFEKITKQLTNLTEGRLWLIDRLLDIDLPKAFKLAKDGLWLFPEDKRSYRERLIEIHIRRQEMRQAASLSYIQFQSEPNLDEYLRLKEILKNHPGDWQSYTKQIAELITNREEKLLAIEIAMVEADFETVQRYFDQILNDESLLMAAMKLLNPEKVNSLNEIYPVLIKKLFNRGELVDKTMMLELLAAYKKYCYQYRQREAWDRLREELNEVYGDDIWFKKKFGSLLIS